MRGEGESPRPRFERILVVDDDENTRNGFARSRVPGCTVITAITGVEALEVVRAHRPDLVILDLRLERESGLDVLRSIRELAPSLPVVIMSGYLSVAAAAELLGAGAAKVVFKPISLPEVLREFDTGTEVVLDETPTLARAEWEHMMRVLHDCRGNVTEAATRLGIRRTTLQRKRKRLAPTR